MPVCTTPERRREPRQFAIGKVALFLAEPTTSIAGELTDMSCCGFRIRHTHVPLQPSQVFRITYNNEEKVVRTVWMQNIGVQALTGLLNQEVYLIDRLRNGDAEAFSDLISPYMRSVRWTVRAILYNQADVEEVVQESLLKAMLHLDQFRLGQNFRSWLLKIASNEALKCVRRNRKQGSAIWTIEQSAETEDELVDKLIEQLADPRDTPYAALERKEFLNSIYHALDALDDIYRQIFVLRDLQHLPMPEVAAHLGINIVAANTRLHRARLQIRKQLKRV